MQALVIKGVGMVTAVGHDALSTCAAIRCAIDNFQDTRFLDKGGEWLVGSSVQLEEAWRGQTKLVKMAARAIAEAIASTPGLDPSKTPLLLCIAEEDRPARLADLGPRLIRGIQKELGVEFHAGSSFIARGRVGAAVGLLNARKLIHELGHRHVLIAGVDSFLNAPVMEAYERRDRLLTSLNSNGFIPGEGAAAVSLCAPVADDHPQLLCTGLGFGMEPATVESLDMPLRADGLTQALRAALQESGSSMESYDYRLTDLSGEQYYFKEASLALSRNLRVRTEFFDLWHPVDCIGECGAAIGPALLVLAHAASRKGYSPGNNILCHLGNDAGQRAVALLSYQHVRAA
ncbi:hypothetical protein [Metapseudomonas otitidis]|uniref:hypothetical protein n=1 Tax=Metapseudomonas otitidis TaxID=319939 RepID=UPI0013F636EA|nr:hypothetical protein [Pseudomonas otitidis]